MPRLVGIDTRLVGLFLVAMSSTIAAGPAPVNQVGATYRGLPLGLYGDGSNTPPEEHGNLAAAAATMIRPLDSAGRPATGGKIGLVAIGQSTTSIEFSAFQAAAAASPRKSRSVVLVNGTSSGAISQTWAGSDRPWNALIGRARSQGLSPAQIQVVWIKVARMNAWEDGRFEDRNEAYAADLAAIVRTAKQRFPNLRIAYLSSRIYAGYAIRSVSPEPYAYESAFGIKNLIEAQIRGEPGLNADPTKGPAVSPVILWGPYCWADGVTPNPSTGISWTIRDYSSDGVHPSASGARKVARLLLLFLETDPTARSWFVASSPRK